MEPRINFRIITHQSDYSFNCIRFGLSTNSQPYPIILFAIFRGVSNGKSSFPFWNSLLGAVVAFGLLFLIILLSKGGMGAGDLKYFTLLGFIFGVYPFLLLFFISTLYGTIGGGFLMMRKKVNRKAAIPFGPYIGLAALTVFYFGESILHWYWSFLS
ncbi:A24 family peptidase [Jeotgalibaca sp. MA1X17-3]|uniref:prepilin peptidase n=1 Tax=Jeotgalibaca sp. MA1X17-3 TaxID=2908211 RepID=UPI001F17E221|nr:A24 family peptidase [Jeotgalibaca sp. MA1X17-3]UJF14834.1 A24 family peptidase [Jeotgalibaca sp. MA1X17-3]